MQQGYQCPQCGATVTFGVRFCGNCGTELDCPTRQIQQSMSKRHQSRPSREIDVSAYIEYVCPHCGSRTAFTWEFGVSETENEYYYVPSKPPLKLPFVILHKDAQGNLTVKDICDKEGDKLVSRLSTKRSMLTVLFSCAHCASETDFLCGIAVALDEQGRILLMPSDEPHTAYTLPVVILMADRDGNLSVKGIYHT
jgi:DNA-directed RNA polymerase subunit RPC12/RpoP